MKIVGNNEMYKLYIDSHSSNANRITKLLARKENIEYLLNRNKDWIALNTNTTLDKILEGKVNAASIVVNDHILPDRSEHFTGSTGSIKPFDIVTHVIIYCKINMLLNKLRDKELATATHDVHNKILNLYINKHVSSHILNGGKYKFGHNLGTIFIKEKKWFSKTDDRYNSVVIDWGESNKMLLLIAKTSYPELYAEYEKGEKGKLATLRKNLKPYLYNKDTNPNGQEWLVRRTANATCWVVWEKGNCTLPNVNLYSFVPFTCHNEPGTKLSYVTRFNIDQVKDLRIGFVEKMRLYLRLDEGWHAKYQRDEGMA